MGSLAFWQETNGMSNKKSATAVMNFNLWSHCGKNADSFLDIGFKISNFTSASKYFFYIPFGSPSEISDLAPVINKSKIIGAIFNEKFSITDLPNTDHFWPVKDESQGEPAFIIYAWGINPTQSAVKVTKQSGIDGSLITIDADTISRQIDDFNNPNVKKECDFYFRFRIALSDSEINSSIVRSYKPKNTFLQSTFATTYIVDFRFNDIRSLPDDISSTIIKTGNSFVDVTKLHFFLMTKAHVDVETGDKDNSLRELELNVWDDYVAKKFETKDIVAYHCSKTPGKPDTFISQWEFFAKLRVNNSTFCVLATYLLALGFITIVFNIISSWICSIIGL